MGRFKGYICCCSGSKTPFRHDFPFSRLETWGLWVTGTLQSLYQARQKSTEISFWVRRLAGGAGLPRQGRKVRSLPRRFVFLGLQGLDLQNGRLHTSKTLRLANLVDVSDIFSFFCSGRGKEESEASGGGGGFDFY